MSRFSGAEGNAPDATGQANCRLLEPWYRFRLEVPADMIGRAMSDAQRRSGTPDSPSTDGGWRRTEGEAPAFEMRDYARISMPMVMAGSPPLSAVISRAMTRNRSSR